MVLRCAAGAGCGGGGGGEEKHGAFGESACCVAWRGGGGGGGCWCLPPDKTRHHTLSQQHATVTTPALSALVLLQLTLVVRFGQVFPGHQMHYCCFTTGKLESSERDVAVKEATLVDEPQNVCRRHLFIVPIFWPIVIDMLRDFCCR